MPDRPLDILPMIGLRMTRALEWAAKTGWLVGLSRCLDFKVGGTSQPRGALTKKALCGRGGGERERDPELHINQRWVGTRGVPAHEEPTPRGGWGWVGGRVGKRVSHHDGGPDQGRRDSGATHRSGEQRQILPGYAGWRAELDLVEVCRS